jgi:RpiB/LacA/LacB family sugar-phosphate isomerase
MIVYLGSDHGGFSAKEQLKEQLRSHGYSVEDCGAEQLDMNDDYPTYGEAVAVAVRKHPGSRGVAMCRSGHGMVITANKVPGVRAILGTTKEQTVQSHEHDNANVLVFGTDYIDERHILPICLAWLEARFDGGRHTRRLNEINDLEKRMSEEI